MTDKERIEALRETLEATRLELLELGHDFLGGLADDIAAALRADDDAARQDPYACRGCGGRYHCTCYDADRQADDEAARQGEPSPEAREAAREWGMSELIVGMPVRHRSTGLIGTVRDPDYRHRYTRRDGEVAEWECVLVEWPDDEWCGVVAREELERVASSPTDEDTLDGETSWPPPEVTS